MTESKKTTDCNEDFYMNFAWLQPVVNLTAIEIRWSLGQDTDILEFSSDAMIIPGNESIK